MQSRILFGCMNSCMSLQLEKTWIWRMTKEFSKTHRSSALMMSESRRRNVDPGTCPTWLNHDVCKNKRNIFFFFFCISCSPTFTISYGGPDFSSHIYVSAVIQTCEKVYERRSCEIKQTVSINPYKLDQWTEQTFWPHPGGAVRT